MKTPRHYVIIILSGIIFLLTSCNIPYNYKGFTPFYENNVTTQNQTQLKINRQEEDIFTKVKEDIENNRIDKAYHLLYRLYKMQEKTGEFSCSLLYELGVVSILSTPPKYNMMNRCFEKAQDLSCYDFIHNYYLKALIRIWRKEKQERFLYEKLKDRVKYLNNKIQEQNQQIQQLQQQISNLEFKLKKINQIHQEIEKNRSLPLNIIPQNPKR